MAHRAFSPFQPTLVFFLLCIVSLFIVSQTGSVCHSIIVYVNLLLMILKMCTFKNLGNLVGVLGQAPISLRFNCVLGCLTSLSHVSAYLSCGFTGVHVLMSHGDGCDPYLNVNRGMGQPQRDVTYKYRASFCATINLKVILLGYLIMTLA